MTQTKGVREALASMDGWCDTDRLRAALSFYADHLSYGACRFEGKTPDVIKDGGRLARAVLKAVGEGHD